MTSVTNSLELALQLEIYRPVQKSCSGKHMAAKCTEIRVWAEFRAVGLSSVLVA
jgi:hypothetical protein